MKIRYDFFYKNGLPKWRGTGYYYSRFRPGLGVSSHFAMDHSTSSPGCTAVRASVLDNRDVDAAVRRAGDELQTRSGASGTLSERGSARGMGPQNGSFGGTTQGMTGHLPTSFYFHVKFS